MKTRSAVLHAQPGEYEVTEVELDGPRRGELLVRMAAVGLCHTDDHVAVGDSPASRLPVAGGHEGAGVVVGVGPETPGWAEGDHVVLSFTAVCGECRMCSTGRQNLCDLGGRLFGGGRIDDPTSFRMTYEGRPVVQAHGISALSEHTVVDVRSVVRIDPDVPLDKAALVSCGVATGWGSVTHMSDARAGDVVIVMGVGGVGINSVQAARAIGARAVIGVDPVDFKRECAEKLGATHTAATMEEASAIARSLTDGQGADATIVTVGVVDGGHVAEAVASVRKAGTVVLTGTGGMRQSGIPINNTMFTVFQKRLQGALFGGCNPRWDIPHLLTQYAAGTLRLDELVTRTYTLDEVAQGYRDMRAGHNIRGMVRFD
ncbi:S-(hydroxymethyl)glutathione dehydrogenase / alcohol dehydrogenase [Geodermatophilus telluris]|uniref:S-(Hydroxymethyl)glutathione dehydrogenase / alcohol dehydrogenase n=1 Tax=Geodermatophilus telluris TaxID=1190417 RepID=A0A1G6LX51_9ACTN|nr:NDMA-dependent alcohol dehydrogenase [Geodermatophilus telluris]SDC47644.1 S-(hydroxymethyl)glutathione dehydrogenase / alcohol dehydrogenase [Geodermatophilus telluris]